MKILFYTETYASETVTFITNEIKYLENHHEVALIYSKRKNPERYAIKNMYHAAHSFNRFANKILWWLEQSQLLYRSYNQSFSTKINKIVSEFNPDIIHCHFGTDFLKFYENLNELNRRKPILISFYGYDVTERIKNKAVVRKYHHYLNKRNVHSIAVSSSLVHNINTYIKPYHAAIVLNSGIDVNFFQRITGQINSEYFTFLQVASFNEKKGQLRMLDAFAEFLKTKPQSKFKLIIAGFGPAENKIREKIQALSLSAWVELRGPVTPKQMVELASQCNCFVHMSETAANGDQEGLPNVILEAMALELPILTTNHAGIPEIVQHKENGILCEEKNIKSYVEGFEEICNWQIKSENRQRIVDHFSFQKHMQQLESLYHKISSN